MLKVTDTTPKTNNFGLLSKATKFTVMITYLKKSATNYIWQSLKVNTFLLISRTSLKPQAMNSGLRKLPIIGLAGFILIGLAIGSKPTSDASRISPAPSFKKNDVPETKYSFSFADRPKSLMDSIQEMANKLGKRIYEYQVEIEIIPENQIYQISNSGYQQYEVTRKGVGYSHTWVKFYTDKKLTYQDAIKFAEKYPEKCIPFVPAPKAKSELDYYNENLDEYLSDPENEIDYAPEIFDFLAD
jgi:hypothetical protein